MVAVLPARGRAQSRQVTDDAVVRQVAGELGATPSQVDLAWLLAHSPLSLVIAGTTSIAHLQENVDAATLRLPDAAVAELDALG